MVYLLPSATKLRQGNVFTPVCHSVHGGCLPQCMLGYTPPQADTPRADTSPGRHLQQTPPWEDTPLGQTPPPLPSRRLLQRTVRILLECILVFFNENYLELLTPYAEIITLKKSFTNEDKRGFSSLAIRLLNYCCQPDDVTVINETLNRSMIRNNKVSKKQKVS